MLNLHNFLLDDTPFSVFESLKKYIATQDSSEFVALHQGKTTFTPCADLSVWHTEALGLEPFEHASPLGVYSLRKAIAAKLSKQYEVSINEDEVVITCGATHAIGSTFKLILNPGEEVLLMSPQWLFASGLVSAALGKPIEVPVFEILSKKPNADFIRMLHSALTTRTKAIYLNTPNNPTGFALSRKQLIELIQFARVNNLWIVCDNAYENYVFTEEGFIDIAQLPNAREITFSIYTFSKTYAMPGYRVGYILPPKSMMERVQKMCLYSIYSVSTASQYAAFQAINTAENVLRQYHIRAREARDITANLLEIPSTNVQGGLYTFLDISSWRTGDANIFARECIAAGVSIAPGIAFGKSYMNHVRLCFTAADNKKLQIGIQRLNKVYALGL